MHHLVKCWSLGFRSCFTKTGHTTGDDALVNRAQRLMIDAQSLRNTRGKVVEDNISMSDEVIENCQTLFRFQVQGNAFLTTVER